MNISTEKVVSIHYTLKNGEGQILDSSSGGEPLTYLHGAGNIIPGLENALEGKTKGTKFNIVIPPAEAYGEKNDGLIQSVPKNQFDTVENIQPGMQFQARTPQGAMVFTVLEVKGDEIVLDGNPPLAGVTLHFDVEVMDIREATREEIEHGHVHTAGGHH